MDQHSHFLLKEAIETQERISMVPLVLTLLLLLLLAMPLELATSKCKVMLEKSGGSRAAGT